MQYDGLNRPTQTSAGSSANLATISSSYNGRGERTSLSDGTGTTSFSYDALGRMTQLSAPDTGVVGYQYNARGERTQLTYLGSGAPVIDYTSFTDGRLRLVKQGSTTLATYAYDDAGRLSQLARLSGAPGITNYQYDGADRLRAVRTTRSGTVVSGFAYTTGRLGNRASVAESLPTSPAPSSTRLKTATFEAASRVDPFTGVDGLVGTTSLERQTPIKGGASVRVPTVASSYLRETFSDSSTLYVSFYTQINETAGRLQRAFNGTQRKLGDGDARVAATAYLKGERFATGDLQFYKRARDLGLDVEFVGTGNASSLAAAYTPDLVAIPSP